MAGARSTKSLFRAMRAKPDSDRAAALLMELPEARAPEAERRKDDFYPTGQPEAIRALLAADGERIGGLGEVWEPSVGDGPLAREMLGAGLRVVGSDIVDRGWPGTWFLDFMQCPVSPAPAIITNPPYSEINCKNGHGRWLRHMLAMPGWRYCALLLSWDWPAAHMHGFGALLDEHPFTRAYLLRWNLDFTGEGSPPQRNAWFVWDRDDQRSTDPVDARHPDFRWLDRRDNRQQRLL